VRALFAVGLAGAVAVFLAGCGGSQSALRPESKAADDIDELWWIMLSISGVVFAVVLALVVVAVVRNRGRRQGPRRSRGGVALVAVGGAAVPFAVLVALFALSVGTLPATSPAARSESALVVQVRGRQWFWDVTYPASGVRTANEIHIPAGESVRIEVTTGDVIHSFWVPRLNRKIDMIPGRTNAVTLQATRPGVYRGQCAEFCGLEHARMAFLVVAEPKAEFDAWLAAQAQVAARPSTPQLVHGQQVFLGSACVYCHTISGTNASGTVGPDLSHLGSRATIGAGTVPNAPGYLAGWILDPQHLKPGNRMPGTDFDGPELQDLLRFLESLK
jgi:cytochrome c oxidase subunit 2